MTVGVRGSVLSVAAALVLAGCSHAGSAPPLAKAAANSTRPVIGLGAPLSVTTAYLGAPVGQPRTTAGGTVDDFAPCAPTPGAGVPVWQYEVTTGALRAGQAAADQPVVSIVRSACGQAMTLAGAEREAARFFPLLSHVVDRRQGAVVYLSEPLVNHVPSSGYFQCAALGNSAERLGRFSLRVTIRPGSWRLDLGDCTAP
jgi:hypothetical protein